MSSGHFLRSLFEETENKAKEAQDKFNKERQGDIDMYRRVMLDPNSSPEQRSKAAGEIEKLRNIKGKQGPFTGLANFLNTIKGYHGKMQKPPDGSATGAQSAQPEASGQPKPQMQPPPSSVGGAKQNVAERALQKVGKGLGYAAGVADRALTGQTRPGPSLPAFDTGVIPTKEEISARDTAIDASEKKSKLESTLKAWTESHGGKQPDDKQQEAIFDSIYGIKSGPITGRTFSKKATIVGKDIPEGTADMYGNPVDPNRTYDFFENGQGDKQYIPLREKQAHIMLADETGKPAEFAFDPRDPTKLIKIGAKPEQAEYKLFTDPNTQEQYAKPVPRFVAKPGVPSTASGSKGGMKPPPGYQKSPTGQPSASNGQPRAMAKPPNTGAMSAVARLDKLGKESTADYQKGKGIFLGKKDTNTARAKAEQALVVIGQGEDLIKQIQASRDALGPWSGRISSFEAGLGSADEKVRSLYTALKSFAALQPALHGSRGIGMQKEFENASGKLADNPDAAIAAIQSLMNTAKHFAEVGGEGGKVSSSPTSNANAEKEAQQYLDSQKKK